jgi:glycosyltransferase involved in cell wall biosynthesis
MKVAEHAPARSPAVFRGHDMRVLMSAYQCAPGMGSVSQIGWEWYSRMAARVPVTLVTHIRNRTALEAAGAPVRDSEIVYIDTEWFAGPVYRLASRLFPKSQHSVFLLSSVDFYVYDDAARRLLIRRRREGDQWDVVHAVTPVSPIASTRLYGLGLPLIVGPWNGGLPSPANFPEIMKQDSAWLYPIRNIGRFVDLLRGGSRRAEAILTATAATRQSLPAASRSRCIGMIENGVDLCQFAEKDWAFIPGSGGPLRILFVGRLVPFKGIPMLLEAVQRFSLESPVEVRIVGDGPMESEWTRLAATMGLSDYVEFCGPAPLSAVPAHIAWSHIFCLPSVRESGGAVLLEAMAVGRPVVAIAYGGPAELIDGSVGKALPPDGKDAVIHGLLDVFRDVVRRPDHWRRCGQAARRKAEASFGWEAKIDRALSLYNQVAEAYHRA